MLRARRLELPMLADVESTVAKLISADEAYVAQLASALRGVGLEDVDPSAAHSLKRNAAVELGLIALVDRIRAQKALSALVALLKQEDAILAEAAAEAIGRFGPHAKTAVPALIDAYRRFGASQTAATLLEALGRIGGPEAMKILRSAAGKEARRSNIARYFLSCRSLLLSNAAAKR